MICLNLIVLVILATGSLNGQTDTQLQCNLSVMKSNESASFFIRTVTFRMVQQSMTLSSQNLYKYGIGAFELPKLLNLPGRIVIQFRFKFAAKLGCLYMNKQRTSILPNGYEVTLLNDAATSTALNRTYLSDLNLIIDLTRLKPIAYGFDLTIRMSKPTDPSPNIELILIIGENINGDNLISLKDSLLEGACTVNQQCDKLINGFAQCVNGKCKCALGVAINEYQCSQSPIVLDEMTFQKGQKNTVILDKLAVRTMSFIELSKVSCGQNKDCMTTFLDSKMRCWQQKCVCDVGYRLLQFGTKLVCSRAKSSSILRVPQQCELPQCDIVLYMFLFKDQFNNSLVSMRITSDHYLYLQEYFQVVLNGESLKVLVDAEDKLRLVLYGKLKDLYRAQAQQNGFRLNRTRRSHDDDAFQAEQRFKRYVLATDNKTNWLPAQKPIEFLINYDPDEYLYLNNYINFWFQNMGNLTNYNMDFNANFSRLILDSLMSTTATANAQSTAACVMMDLIKGNFVQMSSSANRSHRIPFLLDSLPLFTLNKFLMCLNVSNQTDSQSNSWCKNGLLTYDSPYPLVNYSTAYDLKYCLCMPGFMGSECNLLNPCYALVNEPKNFRSKEPITVLTKICQNDGFCVPTRASRPYTIRTNNSLFPVCICRPQYSGKICEKNLDSCAFPFIYKGKFQSKCLIDANTRRPWCSDSSVKNFDKDPRSYAECRNLPCKTPWKQKSNFYYSKCLYKRYRDAKGFFDIPYCSLTRNFDLYNSWRFCDTEDL
jgi:hypothetical protein